MKSKRFLALGLLLLLAVGLLIPLWGGVRQLEAARRGAVVIYSPYTLSGLDRLRNEETGEEWSLYPYAHWNGECRLPMGEGEPLEYNMNMVRYVFRIEGGALAVDQIEFYTQEHWLRLYEKDGGLYAEQRDRSWPFSQRRLVCELSPETGFYAPVKLAGLGGCGIVTLSAEDPGEEGEIRVYVPTEKGWERALFVLADGAETETFSGYVCRRRDGETLGYSIEPATGQMELGMAREGGYDVYQVAYSEGKLFLTPGEGREKWTY